MGGGGDLFIQFLLEVIQFFVTSHFDGQSCLKEGSSLMIPRMMAGMQHDMHQINQD